MSLMPGPGSARPQGDLTPDITTARTVGPVLYIAGWIAWLGLFVMAGRYPPQHGYVWPHIAAWCGLLTTLCAALFVPVPAPLGSGVVPLPLPDPILAIHQEVFCFAFLVVYAILNAQGKWETRWCLVFPLLCAAFACVKRFLYHRASLKVVADTSACPPLASEMTRRTQGGLHAPPLFGTSVPIIGMIRSRRAADHLRHDVEIPSTTETGCCGSSSTIHLSIYTKATPSATPNTAPPGQHQGSSATPGSYGTAGADPEAGEDVVVPSGMPVLFYIHGGAWVGGSHSRNATLGFTRKLAEEGWVVISCSYRKKRWPLHLTDCATGLRWAYDNAAKYGGDTSGGIHLSGASAGGQIAAMLASLTTAGGGDAIPAELFPTYSQLKGVVPLSLLAWYPAMDPKDDCKKGTSWPWGEQIYEWFFRLAVGMETGWDAVQPCWLMKSADCRGFPPCLILHGVADSVVPMEHSSHFFRHLAELRHHDLDLLLPLHHTRHSFEICGSPLMDRAHEIAASWLHVAVSRGPPPPPHTGCCSVVSDGGGGDAACLPAVAGDTSCGVEEAATGAEASREESRGGHEPLC